ncbi:hypothetical protein Q5741_13790 [Paenibacillus sp. JX-17]|uniref:Ferric oxidoreductase domain-containing protein n=1 Tax=Paenibacillus lacisoli TaxID=3064525 RepID=A0ABT9CFY4_9BACL|nr:hypothetical protein [Paenibacillus sp. JX-17]MDO7907478.1 hypothetical protein [Paenibacillus sp. JX-17]
MSEAAVKKKKRFISKKDRKWVVLSLIVTAVIVAYGLWNLLHVYNGTIDWNDHHIRGVYKSYGSQARILLFIVLAYYVVLFVLKRKWLDAWGVIKRFAAQLLKVARRLHVPVAIIAMGLIALHVIGAFLFDFRWDFSHITGLLAGLALLPVPIAGIFRYKKLDRQWHLRSGLAFAVLFLIHAFL